MNNISTNEHTAPCATCHTPNPGENKFCRECGASLLHEAEEPEKARTTESAREEREQTAEKVARLLTDSFALAEQHKEEEAILLALEATRLMPQSSSAHALLVTLYQRTQQQTKAVAAMERVVALNPDSLADREKLDRLKRGTPVLPTHAPKKNPEPSRPVVPFLPALVGLAAASLVLAIGMGIVRGSQKPKPTIQTTGISMTSPHPTSTAVATNGEGADVVHPPINTPINVPNVPGVSVAPLSGDTHDPFVTNPALAGPNPIPIPTHPNVTQRRTQGRPSLLAQALTGTGAKPLPRSAIGQATSGNALPPLAAGKRRGLLPAPVVGANAPSLLPVNGEAGANKPSSNGASDNETASPGTIQIEVRNPAASGNDNNDNNGQPQAGQQNAQPPREGDSPPSTFHKNGNNRPEARNA